MVRLELRSCLCCLVLIVEAASWHEVCAEQSGCTGAGSEATGQVMFQRGQNVHKQATPAHAASMLLASDGEGLGSSLETVAAGSAKALEALRLLESVEPQDADERVLEAILSHVHRLQAGHKAAAAEKASDTSQAAAGASEKDPATAGETEKVPDNIGQIAAVAATAKGPNTEGQMSALSVRAQEMQNSSVAGDLLRDQGGRRRCCYGGDRRRRGKWDGNREVCPRGDFLGHRRRRVDCKDNLDGQRKCNSNLCAEMQAGEKYLLEEVRDTWGAWDLWVVATKTRQCRALAYEDFSIGPYLKKLPSGDLAFGFHESHTSLNWC